MRVTLAHQPLESRIQTLRISKACDDCVGTAIRDAGVSDATITALMYNQAMLDTLLYNVFIPGVGTSQFWLHDRCADALSKPA